MSARVLVVEDHPETSLMLKELLSGEGYKVTTAHTAESALASVQESTPHLILLDVGLPGFSGMELCRHLRQRPDTAAIPILMLTQYRSERDKVAGLDSGADDYVTKPFSPSEMKARVRALLRRAYHGGALRRVLRAASLEVDLDRRTVLVRGKPAALRPKEFDLLAALMENQGRVMTYQGLAGAVWGPQGIATRVTIKVTAAGLREKLGPLGSCIVAVTGIGYKFEET